MEKRDFIYLSIIVVLLTIVVLVAGQYYLASLDNWIAQNTINQYKYNEKVLNFTRLFVIKVLQAKGEVSFDDRLQLENAVRDINSKPILDQWRNFTNAKTEAEAQQQVKDLLQMLVGNINY